MKRKVVISPTDILECSVQVRLKLQQVDDQLSRATQLTQPIVDGLGLHGRQGDEGERLHTLLCQVSDALLGCLVVVHHHRIHLPPQRNCHRHIVLPLADLGQLCDLAMHPCGHGHMSCASYGSIHCCFQVYGVSSHSTIAEVMQGTIYAADWRSINV